jgi:glycosyltransferase involved in cell wall biosynthesis
MHIINQPSWVARYQHQFERYEDIPSSTFDEINTRLDRIQSDQPLVTILIAAWNEEINILNCISSLSDTTTKIPIEFVVVNNNSQDHTQVTLDRLHIRSFFQPIQGCGPARQMGQEQARGKYILLADADCIYPQTWVDDMLKQLTKPGVVCVYGRYSFLPEKGYPRWKLFLLEKMKDIMAEIRHIKRPYLNAFGISMGYVREYGLKAGYVMHNIRGEDGRLCFDMMKYGKVVQVKTNRSRAWTGPRTLQRDGNFNQALKIRIRLELSQFFKLFKPHPPHDTKTSKNEA